jgi:hypothetical protein
MELTMLNAAFPFSFNNKRESCRTAFCFFFLLRDDREAILENKAKVYPSEHQTSHVDCIIERDLVATRQNEI